MHKLRIFERYLRSQGFPLEVGKITTEHLRRFLVHLRESVKADELNPHKPAASRPLSPHTIRGYAQALKPFFSWATQEGLIEENPWPPATTIRHQEHSHPLLSSPALFPRGRSMISVTVVV